MNDKFYKIKQSIELNKNQQIKQLPIHVVGVIKGKQLKCKCKYATFTRVVNDDYQPQCGKCWKPI